MADAYEKYKLFPDHEGIWGNNYRVDSSALTSAYDKYKGVDIVADTKSNAPNTKMRHRDAILRPNVVRIEVLTPAARRRYLNGGLVGTVNRRRQVTYQAQRDQCKELVMDSLTEGDFYEPFFGISDSTGDGVEFGVSSDWKDSKGGLENAASTVASTMGTAASAEKKVTGFASGMLSMLPGAVGTALGGATNLIGGGLAKATSLLGLGVGKLNEVMDTVTGSAGVDVKSAGACTLKSFSGSNFSPVKSVTCKWYMPEQENLARLSIGRLIRMAYSRGLTNSTDVNSLNNLFQLMGKATIDNYAKAVANNSQALVDSNDSSWIAKVGNEVAGIMGKGLAEGMDLTSWAAEDVAKALGGAASVVFNTFGNSMTIEPRPIRLTIGQILDVEPLVISSVDVQCSKEQFVSSDGYHIPIFVSAKITFDMWMRPNPNTGFIQFLGDPLFNMEDRSSWVSDNTTK